MALITLDPNELYDYIPRFDRDNHKDPFSVKIKYVSHGEYKSFLVRQVREAESVDDPEKRALIYESGDMRFFAEHIKGFENWEICPSIKKRQREEKLTDAELFYLYEDKALVTEVNSAITSASILTEGQRKN